MDGLHPETLKIKFKKKVFNLKYIYLMFLNFEVGRFLNQIIYIIYIKTLYSLLKCLQPTFWGTGTASLSRFGTEILINNDDT